MEAEMDLEKYLKPEERYWVGVARCVCNYEWLAVASWDTTKLECPQCGEMAGEPEIT